GAAQAAGHRVERLCQQANLVAGLNRGLGSQIAGANLLGDGRQAPNGAHDILSKNVSEQQPEQYGRDAAEESLPLGRVQPLAAFVEVSLENGLLLCGQL